MLDSSQEDKWLIKSCNDPSKIGFVSSNMLVKKKDSQKLGAEEEEEEENEVFSILLLVS